MTRGQSFRWISTSISTENQMLSWWQLCLHSWHLMLSLCQPTVSPLTTKLTLWQLGLVFQCQRRAILRDDDITIEVISINGPLQSNGISIANTLKIPQHCTLSHRRYCTPTKGPREVRDTIYDLVQYWSISNANALEPQQPCSRPSTWHDDEKNVLVVW